MDNEKNSVEIDDTYIYVGIAVLVILFLVVVNYYNDSEAKILGLTGQVNNLELQLKQSVSKLDSKTADVVTLNAKIDQINADLSASRGLLNESNKTNQGLSEKIAALQREAVDVQSRLQNAQAALQVSQNDLLTARNNLLVATSDNAIVGSVLDLMNRSAAALIDSLMAYYSVNLSASQQTSMRIFADGLKVMFGKTDVGFNAFMQSIEDNYGRQLPNICAEVDRMGADEQAINNISNVVVGQEQMPYCYTDYTDPSMTQGGIIATPIAYQGGVMAAPVMAAPVMAAPVMAAPVMAAPVMAAPVMAAPVMAAPVMTTGTARQICGVKNASGLRAIYQNMGVMLKSDEIDRIRLAIKKVISGMLFQVRAICNARTQGNIADIVKDALQTVRNIYVRHRSAAIINGMAFANVLHRNKYMV